MKGILIYALLSGEYPLNAAKDHIQMNEKVSKHIFELDQSRGQYSEESCDFVRKLLRKNPQRRMKSLAEVKREPFLLNEVNNFINKTLETSDKPSCPPSTTDPQQDANEKTKRSIISENFWNPYVIMENYSPLQMLFDEIYSLKQKQGAFEKEITERKRTLKAKRLPSPPPPPPPPAVIPPPVAQRQKTAAGSNSSGYSPNENLAFDDDSSASTLSSSHKFVIEECGSAEMPFKTQYNDEDGYDEDYEEEDDEDVEVDDYLQHNADLASFTKF